MPEIQSAEKSQDSHDKDEVSRSHNNNRAIIEVLPSQLPLSCPSPQQELWDMHPRVFIDISTTGQASCPYCGAQYQLITSE